MITVADIEYAGVPLCYSLSPKTLLCANRSYVRDYMRRLAKSAPSDLFIAGHHSTGKTWVAAYLAVNFMVNGFNVRYRSLIDIVGELINDNVLASSYGARYDLVVIDDIGAEHNKFAPAALLRILRKRRDNKLATYCVSPLNPEQLKLVYGEAVLSILALMPSLELVDAPDRKASRQAQINAEVEEI